MFHTLFWWPGGGREIGHILEYVILLFIIVNHLSRMVADVIMNDRINIQIGNLLLGNRTSITSLQQWRPLSYQRQHRYGWNPAKLRDLNLLKMRYSQYWIVVVTEQEGLKRFQNQKEHYKSIKRNDRWHMHSTILFAYLCIKTQSSIVKMH